MKKVCIIGIGLIGGSLAKAIKKTQLNAVFTYPNADLGHNKVIEMLKKNYRIKKNIK